MKINLLGARVKIFDFLLISAFIHIIVLCAKGEENELPIQRNLLNMADLHAKSPLKLMNGIKNVQSILWTNY